MRFRRPGRRPDPGHQIPGLLSFLLLPLLVGGGVSALPFHESGASLKADDPEPFWIFLSDPGWHGPTFWEALNQLPAQPRFRSEWLHGISVDVDPRWTDSLRALPGVVEVRPVGALPAFQSRDSAPPSPRHIHSAADSTYGELGEALEALGIPEAHRLGFTGSGVRMGILDGTFKESHETLRSTAPLAVMDFVDEDGSVSPRLGDPPEAASHGTALWSLVAGDLPGVLTGGAPGVGVLLARIRDLGDLTHADEDRWVAGLEWLESQGARIVISGVAFRSFPDSDYPISELDGDTAPATRAADQAAARGVLVVAPVGNGGPGFQSLTSPADGDSVLAVGAVDTRQIPTAFSALGPTEDGRDKPDFYAPGSGFQAASALTDATLEPVNGTEFSAALLASAGALVVEAYPDRGPTEITEILSLSVPEGSGPVVGVAAVASAILFPGGVVPIPVEEVDGNGQLTNLAPLFRWTVPELHPLGLPVTFRVELSEDSLFGGILRSDSVVGTFARRPSHPLPPRTRLFWRILARSPQGIERATPPQGPLLVPSWVTLEVLNDPGGSEIVDAQPRFRWTAPELIPPVPPLVFELQVVSDRETEIVQSYPGLEATEFRVPTPLPFNVPLRWRVIARNGDQAADTVTSAGPFVVTSGARPPATILYQNFPNPFPDPAFGEGETRIWFDLAERSPVELAVFDIRGRLVRHLIPERGCPAVELEAGIYGREGEEDGDACRTFAWNGRDDSDRDLPQGVYLLRLQAGGVVDIRRMILWR